MKYPVIKTTKKGKFYFVNEYKHFALYENDNGIKECFDKFDCGLVPKLDVIDRYGGKYGKMY